jgi:tRNA dimethylallyltransferase
MATKSDHAPLIVIVGETASGKSALALQLAERFDGEIISADSWTVYKGFNIGTAKPNAEEQARVPHHLLDIANPRDGFSAAIFKRLAMQAIDEITGRGKLPILVGGSGLYIDSVLYDYGFLPAPAKELRQELSALDLEQLLKRADELGLSTAAVDTRNKRRVIRLIENNGTLPERHELRANTLVLGMSIPREQLTNRIEARVETMLNAGLEDEAAQLAETYGWEVEPMKGIGYREWQAYFAGQQSRAETEQQIIRGTLALAKKQRTWFKRNKSIHWLDSPCKESKIVDGVTTFLNK